MLCYPAARIWPDGLRYANECWGGPDGLHKYLSDSNLDWGQGTVELDRWTAEQNLPPAHVWYFGGDMAIIKDQQRFLPLHYPQYPTTVPDDVRQHVRGKLVAVSLTILHGNTKVSRGMENGVLFFRGQQPVAKTSTFLIYDFRE